MKKYIFQILALTFIASFTACKVQQSHTTSSTGGSTPVSNNVVTFDLTNTSNIDYGPLKKGYALANDIFMVEVKGYNPLKYKIAATGTSAVNFMNTASPVTTYVTMTTPVATTPVTATGASAVAGPGIAPDDVKKFNELLADISGNVKQMNIDMQLLTRFLNMLADYQSTIENWKAPATLNNATVLAGKQTAYNRMGDIINGYYPPSAVNPYQPSLGNVPNCRIDSYMVTDFPSRLIAELSTLLASNQSDLAALATFETAHTTQMSSFLTSAGAGSASDYAAFKKLTTDDASLVQKFVTDFTANQTPKLAGFAASMSAVETLEYTTMVGPFTLQGNDEVTVKVSKTNMATNIDELLTFPGILIKRHGGVKIDFSAGLFYSTLSDRAYTSTQSTHITQDSTVDNGAVAVKPNQTTFSKITRRGGAGGSYGPMAFIHFHSMGTGLVNYGGFIGTGFMFKDNSKPVIAFGGNLMLVNYQRIILGFGAAMGSVTRLSSQYQEGGSYRATIVDVPTENHFDIKAMFSLSWNLSK